MKEIKIIFVKYNEVYDRDYEIDELKAIARPGMTNWEEISDEDYAFLLKNWDILERQAMAEDRYLKPILLEKDPVSVRYRLDNIKQWIRLQVEEREKQNRLKAEAVEKRQQARLLKKAKTEQALLQVLKEKYPDSGPA
jgi:hypothetical protein